MEPKLRPLEEMPTELGALAAAIPEAQQGILSASRRSLLNAPPSWRESLVLTRSQFRWRFYLARSGQRIVFFFFKKDRPVRVIMDTEIMFLLLPVFLEEIPQPLNDKQVTHRVARPPFLIPRPSAQQLKDFAPAGSTAANTALLAVGRRGQDMLAVKDPHNEPRRAEILYTAGGKSTPVKPLNSRWPLGPFLALAESISDWVSSDPNLTPELPLEPSSAGPSTETRRILQHIVEGYCRAFNQIRPQGELAPLPSLETHYGLEDYQAQVLLRLQDDGSLAFEDDHDPFQLIMQVAIRLQDRQHTAHIAIHPPDFLVSGELHAAFLEALASDRALRKLQRIMRVSRREAEGFLRDFWEEAFVFRIKRKGDTDTDVVVLQGVLLGERKLLIVKGKFRVEKGESGYTAEFLRDLERLFFGKPTPGQRAFDEEVVKHFLRLITAVKSWAGVQP